MRKRPARRLRNKAQPRLPIQPIDLIDDAIDVIRHISPQPFDGAVMLQQRLQIIEALQMLGNRHAPAFDGPHHVHLRLSGHMADYAPAMRSEEHTSELQSLMRISYAVFCLKKKKKTIKKTM